MTDPIADMLNRIRNAQAVSKPWVLIPWSNFKYAVAKVLKKHDLVGEIEKIGKKTEKQIKITLKYDEKRPAIEGIKRVSKPGQRIYASAKDIKKVKGGYGISIVSTPKGIMIGKEARLKKLGGEILAEIW